MIRLYAVSILPLKDAACYEACYRRSSKGRQEKADALQMPDDKARCIAAGLLLEYAYQKFRIEKKKELADANSFDYVQKLAGFPEMMPQIAPGERGKPEFVWPEGMQEKIYFNLSHSGEYVICALADFEVGVDVQKKTGIRDNMLRRFFTAEDRACIEKCGDDVILRERMFAQIWAIKEAETKLKGRGIGQLLEGRMDGRKATEVYHIWQGMLAKDYAWAVVACAESVIGETERLELSEIDGGKLFYEGKV